MAFSFVRSLVKNTLRHGGNALSGGVVPVDSIASAVYAEWCQSCNGSGKDQIPPAAEQGRVRIELENIVQDARAYRTQVDQLLVEFGAGQLEKVRQAARSYLRQLPCRVQSSLRRPEDPGGRTLPTGLVLRRAQDLQKLLPERMPRYRPGARPVPGTDLVIEELLGVGEFGEVWKARHQSRPHAAPVALKFCFDERAAHTLRKEIELLDRISRYGRHRGIVELRYVHLENNPPCLEYEYVDGGDLACLVTDLHRTGKGTPLTMTRLFLSLAQAVGFAHRMKPPVVHRDLKPTNVLTTRIDKGVVLKVQGFCIGSLAAANGQRPGTETLGQGPLTESPGACTPLYASPQQRRGARPDPRDDVYALGVMWYQMLVGDVMVEPPRGKTWKKRLLDQGASKGMLAQLERCLEDDPADRPADAQALAEELHAVITGATNPEGPDPNPPTQPKGAERLVRTPAIALLVLGVCGIVASLIGFGVGAYTYTEYRDGAQEYLSPRPDDYGRWGKRRQEVWDFDQRAEAAQQRSDGANERQNASLRMVLFSLSVAASAVASVAGFFMMELRRYRLCMAGSIAAMLGSPCFLIGIPVGIWALRRLRNPEVISAFR